jgi:hypothetical protein
MAADIYTSQVDRLRKDTNEQKFVQHAHNSVCCVWAKAPLENVAVLSCIMAKDRKVLKEARGSVSYPCVRSKYRTVYYPFYVFNIWVK